MLTLHTGNESRFTALAKLARSVAGAPLSPQGAPCVCPKVTHQDGQTFLVAKTADESHDAQLVLADKDPQRVKACFDYLVERLKTIGLMVVSDESQLQRVS